MEIVLPDLLVSGAEATAGWFGSNSIFKDANERRQGLASLRTTGRGITRFRHNNLPQVDARNMKYLTFWYFIDDASRLRTDRSAQVEISSSHAVDQQEASWDLHSLGLKDGWNFVRLPMPAEGATDIDLSRVRRFRLYHVVSARVVTRIDDIRFTNDLVVDTMASNTGWSGSNSIFRDDNHFIEGTSSLKTTGKGPLCQESCRLHLN